MKRAVIIINGDLTDLSNIQNYIDNDTTIICADGGANNALKQDVIPHVVIGDMDSISSETKRELQKYTVESQSYPREKDYTDSELALQYALDKNYEEIIVMGMLGKRLDHFMANIFHIYQKTKGKNIKIIEGNQEIFFIEKEATIIGKINDQLSLIPLLENCEGVTTEGLQYVLNNETLPLGSTRGISNVFIEKEATLTLKKGVLIAIHTK